MWMRLAGLALIAITPVTANADELSEVKAALASTTKSIQLLQRRIEVLEAEKKKAAAETKARRPKTPALPQLPEASPPVFAPDLKPRIILPSPEQARLEIHGGVQFDAIYDFKSVNPNWEGTLRPSTIPVNCPPVGTDPGCGKDGVTNFNVRASYFDFTGFLPTAAGEVKTELAFDLWGGADTGQTWPRLRQAWGSFDHFLFGYTETLFMDKDVFPNVLDFWGPSGMIFLRDPQIRWFFYNENDIKLALALEVPQAAIDEGKAATILAPPLEVTPKPRYPDITGQFRFDAPWGHVQLAGAARWISFDTPMGMGGNPSGAVFGYGGNLTTLVKTFGSDSIKGQIAYGKGIAAYTNDCCFDLAPNASLNGAVALPLLDWLLYYDHWWSPQWSSSIGFSQNIQTNSPGQFDTDQHIGSYTSVNLLYYPMQNVTVGVEGLGGERVNINGAKGKDARVQFSTRVKF